MRWSSASRNSDPIAIPTIMDIRRRYLKSFALSTGNRQIPGNAVMHTMKTAMIPKPQPITKPKALCYYIYTYMFGYMGREYFKFLATSTGKRQIPGNEDRYDSIPKPII